MLRKEYDLYRKGKIALWDEGMPMGNGDMGGLFAGCGDTVSGWWSAVAGWFA